MREASQRGRGRGAVHIHRRTRQGLGPLHGRLQRAVITLRRRCLLGTHSDHLHVLELVAGVFHFDEGGCQAEIGEFDMAAGRDQYIVWFDIAMHDPVLVEMRQSESEFGNGMFGHIFRKTSQLRKTVEAVPPGDVLHGKKEVVFGLKRGNHADEHFADGG